MAPKLPQRNQIGWETRHATPARDLRPDPCRIGIIRPLEPAYPRKEGRRDAGSARIRLPIGLRLLSGPTRERERAAFQRIYQDLCHTVPDVRFRRCSADD